MPKPVKLRRYDRESNDVSVAGLFAQKEQAAITAHILNNTLGDDAQYFVANPPEESNEEADE